MTTPRPDGHDPIDGLLTDAFASVRAGGARPSLNDVQRRARRHQRRRVTAMAGTVAVMGVAGVAALATRGEPASTEVPAGDNGGTSAGVATSTTQYVEYCVEVGASTTTTNAVPVPDAVPPCAQPPGAYRCVGEGRFGDDGYVYFDYCEPIDGWLPTASTIVLDPFVATTAPWPTSTVPYPSGTYDATTTTSLGVAPDVAATSTTTTLP